VAEVIESVLGGSPHTPDLGRVGGSRQGRRDRNLGLRSSLTPLTRLCLNEEATIIGGRNARRMAATNLEKAG